MKLIDFEQAHFTVLRSWLGNERDVVQWGGPDLAFPLTDQDLQHMLDEQNTNPPRRFCWMAVDAAQAFIGHVQLAMDWKNGVARVGRVMLAPDMRGKGLAAPLLQAVVARAFSHAEIERTELNVYSWNTPALRTYGKVGFVHEVVRRSSAKVGNERWDTVIMAMLRDEWKPRSTV